MQYLLCAVASVYGVLSVIAACMQIKTVQKKDAPIAMLAGGALMLAASAAQIAGFPLDLCFSLLGGIGISLAAWCNGKRSGNFHLSHHVIRFFLTVLLVAGFALL